MGNPQGGCSRRHVVRRSVLLVLGFAAVVLGAAAERAGAQDTQTVQRGYGLAQTLCVSRGLNGALESAAGGDDFVAGTPPNADIQSGANGICESAPAGDDVHPSDIALGQGSAFKQIIRPGLPGSLCRSTVTLHGDDQLRVLDPALDPPGTGFPRQVAVRPDPGATIESTPVADDVLTSLVCPGVDGTIETVVAGDDQLSASSDTRCAICPFGASACITPGANDSLDSTPAGTDEELEYVSAGANGRAQTTAVATDLQAIPVGQGHEDTFCVDSGADGIAQTLLCGNGIDDVDENGLSSDNAFECEDGNETSGDGCSDLCQPEVCGDTFLHTGSGEECDDGNTTPGDGCNAACQAEFCGDGVLQSGLGEQCDDGAANSDVLPDACRTDCVAPQCGDGVVDPANAEPCDDGNTKNNDDCLVALGCALPACGDGFRHNKGTPPFEECDDGNVVSGDGCDATCVLEQLPGCGDGAIDSVCTAGNVGLACVVNADCDTSPGAGDGACLTEECDDGNNSSKDDCLNTCTAAVCGDGVRKTLGTPPYEECDDGNQQPGDGCSASCQAECGNGVIDGACSEGVLGAACSLDEECDTAPGAGDGVCVTEQCDTGIDGLCVASPPTCSAQCTLASCGNGVVECDEQCDLAALNGVAGTGCTFDCARNVIGKREVSGIRECPAAWTLDSPPQDASSTLQRCTDGAACDFDGSVNGSCTFSLGICLNRPLPAGCQAAPVDSADLRGLKPSVGFHSSVAVALTDALQELTAEGSEAPGRCSAGLRKKNCTQRSDCDRYLGSNDGVCEFATGVAYYPALVAAPEPGANQTTACTPGQAVGVPAGEKLRLQLMVRRASPAKGDKDNIRLVCDP